MKLGSILIGLCLLASAALQAQVGEFSISAGRAASRNNVLGTAADLTGALLRYKSETNFRLGFRLTFNNQRHFGHEIGYAYNRGKFTASTTPPSEVGMPVHQGIYNFLAYVTPEGSAVRPFITGGGHFSTFYPPGTGVFSGNGVTKFGFNYGGGIKFRISPLLMLRMDLRDYTTAKPFGEYFPDQKGMLHMLEVSMGVGIGF
ncbi:MAG: outer membrane beta-barrel protein [Bryobacteraceae bacterium]